jgi:hypothetical protein
MLLLIRKHFSSSLSISACFVPQNLATLRHHHFPELVHPDFLDESVEWIIIFHQLIFVSILPFIHSYFTLLDGL